jgi:hypothetical protein
MKLHNRSRFPLHDGLSLSSLVVHERGFCLSYLGFDAIIPCCHV